jgi:hypothetical protein
MRMKLRMKGGPRKLPTSLKVVARMWSEMWGEMWPTPNVPSGGRMMSVEKIFAGGYTENGKRQIYLGALVKAWRMVFEAREDTSSVSSPPGQGKSTPGSRSSGPSRFLNPLFLNWLMAWPPGWPDCNGNVGRTNFDCWETASSRLVRDMLSACCPFDWLAAGSKTAPREKAEVEEPPSMFGDE